MDRSSQRRRMRPTGSRNSARAISPTEPARPVAGPGGGRRLADGLVIDAAIVARLLGVRLLRIEAALSVAPARFAAPRALPVPAARPIGTGLAAARRCIDEGAVSLAASRQPVPRATNPER